MSKAEQFIIQLEKNEGNIDQTCKETDIAQHFFYDFVKRDTEFKKSVFLLLFEFSLGHMHQTCKNLKVSRLEIMRLAEIDDYFALQLWEITEGFVDLAESSLLKMGTSGGQYGEGDSKALKTYLEAKAKNRGYGKIEITERMIYPGIEKPKQKSLTQDFENHAKTLSAKEIKESLSKLKKLK